MGIYEKIQKVVQKGKNGMFTVSKDYKMDTGEYGERDGIIITDDEISFYLWDTNIVTYHKKSNSVKLNTGGWKTKITQDRMNDILHILGFKGYWIEGKKETRRNDAGEWYVVDSNGDKVQFNDKMIINSINL